jgi:hypothetical protein
MSISDSRKRAKRSFGRFCKNRALKDFNGIVQIVHSDGSTFVLHHSSVWYSREKFKDLDGLERPAWVGVSTEHNGDLLFFSGDLLDWWVR